MTIMAQGNATSFLTFRVMYVSMTPAINVGKANTNVDGFVYRTIQSVMDMIFSDMAKPTPASTQKYPIKAKYPPITGMGKYDTALAYAWWAKLMVVMKRSETKMWWSVTKYEIYNTTRSK